MDVLRGSGGGWAKVDMGEGVKTARILWTSFMDGPLVSRVKNFGENSRGCHRQPSCRIPVDT